MHQVKDDEEGDGAAAEYDQSRGDGVEVAVSLSLERARSWAGLLLGALFVALLFAWESSRRGPMETAVVHT